MNLSETDLENLLKRHFNQDEFKPGQKEIIASVLSGKDVMAIADGASDQSICYKLPALVLDGITLVVSSDKKIEDISDPFLSATCINNFTSVEDMQRNLRELIQGKRKMLYLSPDQFRNRTVLHTLDRITIPLLVVEDAHSISRWSHDFRSDYLCVNNTIMEMDRRPTIMALASPCTQRVKTDIQYQFQITGEDNFILNSDHSNLSIQVKSAISYEEKLKIFGEIIQKMYGSGIIYVNSRQQTVDVCNFLKNYNLEATPYHGGMGQERRLEVERNFISGSSNLVVTTNAGSFGAGIDKQDIRYMIHFNMPDCLEKYCQQIHKAGRDGNSAHCILIYTPSDRGFHSNMIERNAIHSGEIWRLRDSLESNKKGDLVVLPYGQIEAETGIDNYKIHNILAEMEDAGMLRILPDCSTQARVKIRVNRSKLIEYAEDNKSESVIIWLLENSRADPVGDIHIDFSRLKAELDYPHDVLEESLLPLYCSDAISYRPLHRGMALCVVDMDISLNDSIFDKLREYKHESLRMMEEYIHDTGCRHQFIANYLGYEVEAKCGECDNCLKPEEEITEDHAIISLPPQIKETHINESSPSGTDRIFNIILRVAEKTQGQLGRSGMIKLLKGEESKKLAKYGFDHIDEYGIFRDMAKRDLLEHIDIMVERGCLSVSSIFFPMLSLTELGQERLKMSLNL